jgi:hypothetical protein
MKKHYQKDDIWERKAMVANKSEEGKNPSENHPTYPIPASQLPEWFKWGCYSKHIFSDPRALSAYLNGLRQDVYSALSLFQVHVRSILTIMLALLAALTAIFSLASRATELDFELLQFVEITGGVILILLFVIAGISHKILARYYGVYVSALLQASQAHYWGDIGGFWWFERIIRSLGNREGINKKDYIKERIWSKKDSNFWYVSLVWFLGTLGLASGIFILVCKPLSS